MKERTIVMKRAQLPMRLKSLCRICLLRASNDAFNDDLIDEADNKKKGINIDHVNNNEINSIQKMFSIHQTMIGNYLVRDLISSITQLEISEDDQLPDQICEECFDRLHIANHFRMQFLSSSKLLQQIVPHTKQITLLPVLKSPDRTFSCCLCPRQFTAELKLLKHAEAMHAAMIVEPSRYTSAYPVACVACNRRFPTWRGYQRHRQLNFRELNVKPFECAHCVAKFSDRGCLTNHLKLHTGKQHSCEYCGTQFSRIDHLKAHIESQHAPISQRSYICDLCSTQFALKQNLQVHMRVHTKERKFECPHCGKRYGYLCDLKRHLFQHEGNSPYECQTCRKRFYSKSNLNVHLRGHQGVRDFGCEVCGVRFSQKHTLLKHRKTIHNIQK